MTPEQKLYDYLVNNTWDLTEAWYAALDKNSTSGVYASNDPEVIQTIKEQNHGFHERFVNSLLKTKRYS